MPPASILVAALAATFAAAGPVLSPRGALEDCLGATGAGTSFSYSSDYSSKSSAYNQRLQPSPVAVVTPSSVGQLRAVIKCARDNGVPVSARGGGHSYASYGLGGTDEQAVVVALDKFNGISVDSKGVATIGGGQRLGNIYLALNDKGKGMSAGTCPFVGIGGHAGFGGYGFAARWKGLAVDGVVGYNVMLANGTFVQNLTPQRDADLFYALNGAAPSYGIVTAYQYQTFEAPTQAVMFEYKYSGGSVETLTQAFYAMQTWGVTAAPASLGMAATVGTGGALTISGVQYGVTRGQFDDTIASFTKLLPEGYATDISETDWIGSLEKLANGQSLDTTGQQTNRDTFFAKSLMTPTDKPLTRDAIKAFFQYLADTETNTNWFVMCDLYGGQNSQINAVSKTKSSFGHRDSLITCQMYASSPTYGLPYPDDGVKFVQGMWGALVSPMLSTWGTSYGAYTNYVDPTLTEDQWKTQYWGSQYDRLARLKSKYDKDQVFRYQQSIRPQ